MGNAEALGPVMLETHTWASSLLASLTAMTVWERRTGLQVLVARWGVPRATPLGRRDERRETHSQGCTVLGRVPGERWWRRLLTRGLWHRGGPLCPASGMSARAAWKKWVFSLQRPIQILQVEMRGGN